MINFKELIDHYDLVEVVWKDGRVGHIPAPWFLQSKYGAFFLHHIPRNEYMRDGAFFKCPICGTPSFYSGICQDCADLEMEVKRSGNMELRKKNVLERALANKPLPHTVKSVSYVVSVTAIPQ